ncbi:cytochrome P450 [Suillus subaureus]|uniref:Cytochrome P450 n=1 Tax=Suillus subaureus TaxID=48587 RepID=A0A9P7E1L9_9AGAM|nr:cytochrome P450 [Suillus subaureus]KAG1808925.1 cytochrome P450 [Suillus subaureus]
MDLFQSKHCGRDIWLAFKDIFLVSPLAGSATLISALVLVSLYLLQIYRRKQRTTPIRGPRSPGWVFGFAKTVLDSTTTTELYERWASEYGPVYKVPGVFGQSKIMLWDPKAISHLFARDTWLYNHSPFSKTALQTMICRFIFLGVLWAEGESHKRQRKALNPALSAAAIRNLTSVFHDAAHKTAIAWDSEIESNQRTHCAVIDVQQWHIMQDESHLVCIFIPFYQAGVLSAPCHIDSTVWVLAVLSHDFGTLDGNDSEVAHILNVFGSSIDVSNNLLKICQEMLSRTRKEKETGGAVQGDKSCLGLLSRDLTSEEATDGARILLLAGFETTAVPQWALVELARNPDVQTKLRDECLEFGPTPSYDDLTNKLPYLDAVANEVLRLHASIKEIMRSAMQEDVIPLSKPMRTAAGSFTESVCIPKGTMIIVPLAALDCSVSMWGPDAKVFKPSRWFERDEGTYEAREALHGYRHLMTFSSGARMCLGRLFALTEFKAVLFVLVRTFVFEMVDGPGVQIVEGLGTLPRPEVVGGAESGSVPLWVRRYEV